jgi:hypothetical protein
VIKEILRVDKFTILGLLLVQCANCLNSNFRVRSNSSLKKKQTVLLSSLNLVLVLIILLKIVAFSKVLLIQYAEDYWLLQVSRNFNLINFAGLDVNSNRV